MSFIPLQTDAFLMATMPIFYILGMVLSVLFPLTIFLFWKRMMPPVLRQLWWAARRKEPLLLLCHDSGRSVLTTIAERQGEGIVLTGQGKYKILPRFAPKLPFGEMIRQEAQRLANTRLSETEQPQTEEGQTTEEAAPEEAGEVLPSLDLNNAFNVRTLKDNFVLDYGDYVNKRSQLIGLDVPVFVGYTGKLCLLNPEALALYEAGEMMIKTNDLAMFNPNNLPDKSEEQAMQPLMLMNPRKIQEIIWQGFDQSQIAGVVADSEELERLKNAGGMSKTMKMLIMVGLIAAVGIGGVMILPNLLNPQQQQSVIAVLGSLIH